MIFLKVQVLIVFILFYKSVFGVRKCCQNLNEILVVREDDKTPGGSYRCELNLILPHDPETIKTNCNIPSCTPHSILSLDNRVDKWFRKNEDDESVEVGLNFWFWPVWLLVKNDNLSCLEEKAKFISEPPNSKEPNESGILLLCQLNGFDIYLTHRRLYGRLYIISFLFILLTLLIYSVLWKELNTHGITQFSFFVSLALFNITEGSRILVKSNGLNIRPTTACFFHAVIAQYFFMTVNTTSVLLGFDLFWTLWKLDPTAHKNKIWKRIYFYNFLSWILPLILITLALVLNHYFSPDAAQNESGIFEYAHYRCSSPLWQSAFYAQCSLYTLNITFFVITSLLIYKHQQNRQIPQSKRAKRLLHETISIHFRLFFILGMTWMAVVVEFFVGQNNPLSFVWLILRVMNLLLGIFYFVLFGLDRKHLQALRAKYPLLKSLINTLGCPSLKSLNELEETLNVSTKTSEGVQQVQVDKTTSVAVSSNNLGNQGVCM